MVNSAFSIRAAHPLPTAVVDMRAWAGNDRILSGQVRESMTALVIKMAKVAIIVTVATNMSLFGQNLHDWVTVDLRNGINELITGNNDSPIDSIDANLAYTQLAMAAIGAVDVPTADVANSNTKDHAELMAMLGIAGPPMTAGALLLLYEVAIALFIGLGPLFILCLLFDQTKALFHKWLMFGIGTLFSLAVLNFMVSLIMQLTLRVAAALWTTNMLAAALGTGAVEGYTNQAMQQGGVGLLMTVLLISVPPMAASFFNATIGQFYTYSGVSPGGVNQRGPQGQPPGAYGGGYAQSARPNQSPHASEPLANLGNSKASAQKDEVARLYPNQQGQS